MKTIVIIGGGPAGMMAGIAAAMRHTAVILLEKNALLGKKLLLTGNGRCNFTNTAELTQWPERFCHGGMFLRDALNGFTNHDAVAFFRKHGVPAHEEDNGCMFPNSNSAQSICDALRQELERRQVTVQYNTACLSITRGAGHTLLVHCARGKPILADAVVIAAGGCSYPQTGSDGSGMRIMAQTGHTVTPLRPALTAFSLRQTYVQRLEGISVPDAQCVWKSAKKTWHSSRGSMVFTRRGISGPLVLTSSSRIMSWFDAAEPVQCVIDMCPQISAEAWRAQLDHVRRLHPGRHVKNELCAVLPQRLVETLLAEHNVDGAKPMGQLTRAETNAVIGCIKTLRLEVSRRPSLETAMVTQGGVSLKEIDPRTMASRRMPGLYCAGEIMDIDGDTGGFNVQAALSTGYCAGKSAAHNALQGTNAADAV